MIKSHATYKTSRGCLKERAFYCQLCVCVGGVSLDACLLNENHHKINLIISEDLLLNEGVVLLFWINSYTTLWSQYIPN